MNNKMEIKTDRLVITEFDPGMIESVHVNSLDEDNRRFVPDEVFETIDDAREVVEFLMSTYEGTEGPFVYPILLHDGTNIGYVQAAPIKKGWEIGYHIAKDHTGKGYSTEAVTAFVPVIMNRLEITEIYGVCHADNIASHKVLEKSGFVLEYTGKNNYQGKEQEVKIYKYLI